MSLNQVIHWFFIVAINNPSLNFILIAKWWMELIDDVQSTYQGEWIYDESWFRTMKAKYPNQSSVFALTRWHRPSIYIHVDSYFEYFYLLKISILSFYQKGEVLKETSSTLECIIMASQKPFGQAEVKNHLACHITYWQYVESTY